MSAEVSFVRCHAALIAWEDIEALKSVISIQDWERRETVSRGTFLIKNNIVVSYGSERLPADGSISCVDGCRGVVRQFTGECHSTVDYNGIVRLRPNALTFIPMRDVADYLK